MIVYCHPKFSFLGVPLVSNVQILNSLRIRLIHLRVLEEVMAGVEEQFVVLVDYEFIVDVLATDTIAADSSVMIIFTWLRLKISMQMNFLS